MATGIKSTKQQTQVKFTNDLKYLGVPQALVEKCLKQIIGDSQDPIWFRISLLQNAGVQLCLVPSTRPDPKQKPFKGWKANAEARRYYISAVGLLKHLRFKHATLKEFSFPATIKEGKIIAVLPPSVRQVQ